MNAVVVNYKSGCEDEKRNASSPLVQESWFFQTIVQ